LGRFWPPAQASLDYAVNPLTFSVSSRGNGYDRAAATADASGLVSRPHRGY